MTIKQMDFSGVKGANWYNESKFSGADVVTDSASNRGLGIDDIQFYKPNGTSARVVASVLIYLTNSVRLEGTLYRAKNNENLTFGVQQRTYKGTDGKTNYVDINVRIPLQIQAQVLRHAETLMIDVPVQAAPVGPTPAQIAIAEAQKADLAQAEVEAKIVHDELPATVGVSRQEQMALDMEAAQGDTAKLAELSKKYFG